jgi:hypothetical protein
MIDLMMHQDRIETSKNPVEGLAIFVKTGDP